MKNSYESFMDDLGKVILGLIIIMALFLLISKILSLF